MNNNNDMGAKKRGRYFIVPSQKRVKMTCNLPKDIWEELRHESYVSVASMNSILIKALYEYFQKNKI